jgi:hypothetical protein
MIALWCPKSRDKSMVRMQASFLCSARARPHEGSGDRSLTKMSSNRLSLPQLPSECVDKTHLQSEAEENSVVIMDGFMRAEWYSSAGSASDRNHLDNMPLEAVTHDFPLKNAFQCLNRVSCSVFFFRLRTTRSLILPFSFKRRIRDSFRSESLSHARARAVRSSNAKVAAILTLVTRG